MNAYLYVSGEGTTQSMAMPLPAQQQLAQVFTWLPANTATRSLADEFAEFAKESLEWAELVSSSVLEIWPDYDTPTE